MRDERERAEYPTDPTEALAGLAQLLNRPFRRELQTPIEEVMPMLELSCALLDKTTSGLDEYEAKALYQVREIVGELERRDRELRKRVSRARPAARPSGA